jgi:hypothetical protein
MCNYNKQNDDTKELLNLLIKKITDSVGGANFLLGLIEEMKKHKPNALMYKHTLIESEHLSISWNKIVFKDKVDVLEEVLHSHKSSEGIEFNILQNDNAKKRKKILNMVKALAPITFVVTPHNSKDGEGFDFKVFEPVQEDYVKINPVFLAMFFCSIDFTKKALKYNPK